MIHWTPGWSDFGNDLVAKPQTRPAVLHRFTGPRHTAPFWIGLGLLALAAEAGALYPVISGSQPVLASDLVYRLVGGSFAACGLIAWHRRPDSHGGALMMATGFGFLLYPLISQIHVPVAGTLAMWLSDVWIFAFLPLILTNLS